MTEIDKEYLQWIGYNDYEIETYEGESYKETNQYDAYMAAVKVTTEKLKNCQNCNNLIFIEADGNIICKKELHGINTIFKCRKWELRK